jgi:hypothetical protein
MGADVNLGTVLAVTVERAGTAKIVLENPGNRFALVDDVIQFGFTGVDVQSEVVSNL